MSCRINQLNKKTNVTYVYESVLYWDKEKKQARNKKICVGKLDPNGLFVPSGRLKPEQAAVRDPIVTASAEVVGPLIILDTITDQLGLRKLLKSCFPQQYQQILMMAYYLTSTGDPMVIENSMEKFSMFILGYTIGSRAAVVATCTCITMRVRERKPLINSTRS